jgi:hypothetical protein
MNLSLHGDMTRKAISIAKPANENRVVDTIKGTGGTARTPAGQVGCNSQECEQPIAFSVFPNKLIPERASTTTQVLDEIRLQRDEPHSHWGLNE